MRRRSIAPLSLAACLAAPLSLGACSEPPGEVVVVIATDLSIPKDIDEIQVEVVADGRVQFYSEYSERQGGLKLPGTLGLVDERSGRPFTVRVIARKDDQVRSLREITTAATSGRVTTLRAPVRWLCDGSGTEGEDGRVELSKCPPGEACFADWCAPSSIHTAMLQPFSAADVFGGGTGEGGDGACFDTIACFEGAKPAELTKSGDECTIPVEGATNVALRTEGDGICGATGCFVPLDHNDPEGFTMNAGSSPRIQVPSIVCDRKDKVLGVVVSDRCARKTAALPTCGPWSLSGGGAAPSPAIPVVLAAGQRHPSSLVLSGGHVFWTNAGDIEDANGAIKRVPKAGGTPAVIASAQAFPSALAASGAEPDPPSLFWINEGAGAVSYSLSGGADTGVLSVTAGARQGLAVDHGEIFWSTAEGLVWRATAAGAGATVVALGAMDLARIAVDDTGVYFTDRGDGKVRKAVKGASSLDAAEIAWEQARPVALAVSETHVYWLNQGKLENAYEDGAVMRVVRTGTNVVTGDEPEVIATSKALPYALAIDEESVYWSNVLDGTIMRAPLAGKAKPTILAVGQGNPIAIAVDQDTVYWANAGTSAEGHADGAIMKVRK